MHELILSEMKVQSKNSGMVNPENISLLRSAIKNKQAVGEFLPSVYVIDPISRCNINCVMCPNSKMAESQIGAISLPKFEQIVKVISPYAEFLMLYWMGEPLLHPKFPRLLEIAKKHIKGKIVVSSNMTVFDTDSYTALVTSADIVLCCIDRWEKVYYERVRRGADLDVVTENTKKLLNLRDTEKTDCEVIVKGLDIKSNTEEYDSFRNYWEGLGAKTLMAWLNTWAGTMPTLRNAASIAIPRQHDERVPCADLWFKMVIDWNGRVQMCCFDWSYDNQISEGITENWLVEAWHGKKMQELRAAHSKGNFGITNLCDNCDSWGEPAEHEAYTEWTENSYFIVF